LASFPQSLPLPRSARNRFRVAETIVQEIGFYFTAQIGDALDRPGEFAGLEDHLIFRWFDEQELAVIDVRPSEIRAIIFMSRNQPIHFCTGTA
jgi:hypothetical protein